MELANEKISTNDLLGIVDSPSTALNDGISLIGSSSRPKQALLVPTDNKDNHVVLGPQLSKNKRSRTARNKRAKLSAKSTTRDPKYPIAASPVTQVAPPGQSDHTLRTGDLVSHARHGIGRFRGLERTISNNHSSENPPRAVQEYVVIEYRDGDVYVSLSHFDILTKLTSAEAVHINKLDNISSSSEPAGRSHLRTRSTNVARKKTRAKIRETLVNLHGLYAARTSIQRDPFSIDEKAEKAFNDSCMFSLTTDQLAATKQVFSDMSDCERPMDRLLCGDVGFGKTEVSMRAAFRALRAGKQVAVLAPTTILAQQHFETFTERMEAVAPEYKAFCFSRFVRRKAILEGRDGIASGKYSIAVGTHMILGEKLVFDNLGLLIVDEEHRFGVYQKERIRARYNTVDTLFLSATPIPRTLHLTLSGLRDASVLLTPPSGRKPVLTKVSPSGAGIVRQAIARELNRGGQVFYVVPRIEGIEQTARWIEELFPTLRVLVAHGTAVNLERRIWDFAKHLYDVLVCTTIIENGINMPNVNTIIIQDAGRFGLAQLHQLRGRVGRSDIQAYAVMLFSNEAIAGSASAYNRLKVLEDHSKLGSGFVIAQRDMEMRGVGTILGVEQHGNTSVGAKEYAQMLSEELDHARTGKPIPLSLPCTDSVEVFLPVASLIPEDYIASFDEKMNAYSCFSSAKTSDELLTAVDQLENRYGPLPPATRRHVSVLEIKLFAKDLGISRIVSEREHIFLTWSIDEAVFNRLVAFLPDEKSRARWEQRISDEQIVIRGLGVCSGDVQLAKVRTSLECFSMAAVDFKRDGDIDVEGSGLAEALIGLSN